MAQTPDKKSRAEQTADQLCELIMSGEEFRPGDRLPNELELSGRFHVSRATLREAIRTLVVRGIIEVRHGIGTFVVEQLPDVEDYGFQDLANIKTNTQDLFEARLIFEPKVSALAVERATDAEIMQLVEIEEQIERNYREGIDVMELDRQFHTALLKCVRNPFLEQVITIINDAIEKLLLLIEVTEVQAVIATDHRYIKEFLQKRDCVGVESAMKIHILHGVQQLEEAETSQI